MASAISPCGLTSRRPGALDLVPAAEGAATVCGLPVAVIINPISGTGGRPDVARQRAEQAAALLSARGGDPPKSSSPSEGHARELALAALARGISTIVAWGGDGTVNEVATAVAFRDAAHRGRPERVGQRSRA